MIFNAQKIFEKDLNSVKIISSFKINKNNFTSIKNHFKDI